jgi:hypothetical protein
MIVVHLVTVQPVVHTVTAIRVHRHAQVQTVPIVHHVRMVTAQNVVMIVVLVPIDQQVVHTVIAIHVQVLVHHQIAANAVTVRATHVRLPIAHVVARRVDRQIDAMTVILDRAIHDPRQINPAEATHTVAIAHAQVMIAMPVHHAMIVVVHVTANAAVDQIALEVVSPMIVKSVHAVALAKSA